MHSSFPPWLRSSWVHGLLLLAVTVAAYSGVTQAGFVFDDHALVLYNEALHDIGRAWSFFGQDLWATADGGDASGYYRPLMALSLAVDWSLAGDSPVLYHLHSLAWHLLGVWCLHRLLVGLTGPLPALMGAAIFALHPVQSEAVVWIAARNDLMGAALLLGAVVLLRPLAQPPWRLALGALLALGAVLSKENTLLLPVFLIVLDLAEHGRPRGWPRHMVLWGAVALHLIARSVVGVNAAVVPGSEGWWLLARQLPVVLALPGGLLAWPWPLSIGRDLVGWSLSPLATAAGLVCGVSLVAGLLWARRRLVFVGLAWAGMGFAPALLAVADKGVFGERYLYLSMAGLGLALASAVDALPAARRRWLGVGLVVVLSWVSVIHTRTQDWKDDVSIWRAAARDTPCTHAYASLGHVQRLDGDPVASVGSYLLALRGEPSKRQVCPDLLNVVHALGDIEAVVAASSEAVELGCSDPVTLGKHASYLAMGGRWAQAVEVASALEQDDIEGRARLVLAAADMVEGRCSRYRELRADWTGDLDAQMMRLLGHGDHPELARALAEGALCSESSPAIEAVP